MANSIFFDSDQRIGKVRSSINRLIPDVFYVKIAVGNNFIAIGG